MNLNLLEKKISILDPMSFFFYTECSFFYIYSYLGILKFYNFKIKFFIILFSMVCSFKYLTESSYFINNFIDIIYGNFIKFKIIGLGYKLFYCTNLFLFKLGYSHLVFFYFLFSLNSKKKIKKKKFFKLYSFSKIDLSYFFNSIQFFRYPHIFSKNGIYNKNDLFFFKKGKKSFLL